MECSVHGPSFFGSCAGCVPGAWAPLPEAFQARVWIVNLALGLLTTPGWAKPCVNLASACLLSRVGATRLQSRHQQCINRAKEFEGGLAEAAWSVLGDGEHISEAGGVCLRLFAALFLLSPTAGPG